MKQMKKVFLYIFTILFLISSSFALSINIFCEVSEYSKIYTDSIYVSLNCGESLNLTFPKSSTNVHFNEVPVKDNFIFLDNCKSKNVITYKIDKLEDLGLNNFRIERNFLGYENINYTYSLFMPLNYEINTSTSIPNNFNIILNNNIKLVNFHKNNIYVIYISEITESSSLNLKHFQKEIKEHAVQVLEKGIQVYGIPKAIVNDHGTQFVSLERQKCKNPADNLFQQTLKKYGIKQIKARVKHPQTNGNLERLFYTTSQLKKHFRNTETAIHYYNFKRPHMSLENGSLRVPFQAFIDKMRN